MKSDARALVLCPGSQADLGTNPASGSLLHTGHREVISLPEPASSLIREGQGVNVEVKQHYFCK